MAEAGATVKTQPDRVKAPVMNNKAPSPVPRTFDDQLKELRGKVIAIRMETQEILACASTFEELVALMKDRHGDTDYVAYGVPTTEDFSHALELQRDGQ